jgi:hypothetical protein
MTDSSSGVLTPEEAAKFLNEETIWAPGWSVKAYAVPYPVGDGATNTVSRLHVTLQKESKNSSAPAADGTYTEPWTLQFPLAVPEFATKGKDALVFWVLEKINWCDEHENREFARYRLADGSWYAPFHPHRGFYDDQSKTPEWQAQYRDPDDRLIAGRK